MLQWKAFEEAYNNAIVAYQEALLKALKFIKIHKLVMKLQKWNIMLERHLPSVNFENS